MFRLTLEIQVMTNIRVKVPYLNPVTGAQETRDGIEVGFKPITPETFMEYELEDGSVLKMRQTVQKVIKIEGEVNPNTNMPVYVVQAQGNMSVGKKE